MKQLQLIALLVCAMMYYSFQDSKIDFENYKNNDEAVAKGKVLYDQKCALCHALPTASLLTKQQRKKVVPKMTKKAGLGRKDKKLILLYVNSFPLPN